MLASIAFAAISIKPLDFYAHGPYEANVPRPESILKYGPGERHTTFRDQELVVRSIVEHAKSRTKLIEFGRSVEGRPLKVIAISSEKNIARLSQIQRDLDALSNPTPGQNTADIQARTPAIVWINECIHGNETASFESAMWLLYNLAASRNQQINTALDNTVVLINPVYNPDGHERYVVYYNSLATGSSDRSSFEGFEPGTVYGRVNHYRFDMNRDRVSMSQDETRQEVAEFLRWHPQVYADQHGQVETYFFPPNPMSVNVNVDRARVNKWTTLFGKAAGKDFDQNGFLYFVSDVFDLYYPGYLDSWTSLSGAIGMTHETDGGKVLARERPDGSILTLRNGVEKHFTSALSLVVASAANRHELMADYAKFKADVTSGKAAGKFQRVIIDGDQGALARLQKQLGFHGIKSEYLTTAYTSQATDYWSGKNASTNFAPGSLIVDMAQPQGAVAKSLLEPGSDFEAKFIKEQQGKKKTAPEGEKYPGPDGAEFYDVTGWSLPFAHNLKAWWRESAPKVSTVPNRAVAAPFSQTSSIGYAIEYRDDVDILAVFRAMAQGIKVSVTTKPMTVGGHKFDRGTFLFLNERNAEGFEHKLFEIANGQRAHISPILSGFPEVDRDGPGSESVRALKKPSVAVVFGNQANLAQVGSMWYLLDRVFELPFTAISSNALNGDLGKYTCIVVPAGVSASASGKLKDWVSAGGSLVVLDNPGWAIGSSGFVELSEVKGEFQGLPGSLFRAQLDPRSFLSFGYPSTGTDKIEIAVPFSGSTFYQTRKEGGSVVTFAPDAKVSKLLSGWEWPDETEKALQGTTWLQDVPVGRGHAILFTQDPTERALWPGLYKMLLNAMLIGAG